MADDQAFGYNVGMATQLISRITRRVVVRKSIRNVTKLDVPPRVDGVPLPHREASHPSRI